MASDVELLVLVSQPRGSSAEFHDDVLRVLKRAATTRVLDLNGFLVDARFLEGFSACFWTREHLGDEHYEALTQALIEHHEGRSGPTWERLTHTPIPWGDILRDAAHRQDEKAQETLSRLSLYWMQDGVPPEAIEDVLQRLVRAPEANTHVVTSLSREVRHSPTLKTRALAFVAGEDFSRILPEQQALLALVLLDDTARINELIRRAPRPFQGRLVAAWERQAHDRGAPIDRGFCCELLLSILPDNPEGYGCLVAVLVQLAPDPGALVHYVVQLPAEVRDMHEVAKEIRRIPSAARERVAAALSRA